MTNKSIEEIIDSIWADVEESYLDYYYLDNDGEEVEKLKQSWRHSNG